MISCHRKIHYQVDRSQNVSTDFDSFFNGRSAGKDQLFRIVKCSSTVSSSNSNARSGASRRVSVLLTIEVRTNDAVLVVVPVTRTFRDPLGFGRPAIFFPAWINSNSNLLLRQEQAWTYRDFGKAACAIKHGFVMIRMDASWNLQDKVILWRSGAV